MREPRVARPAISRAALAAAIAVISVAVMAGALMAHGARSFLLDDMVGIRAEYDDGSPMSFCDVFITGPSDSVAVRAGATDSSGVFSFLPSEAGSWKVYVDDGLGHRTNIDVEASAAGLESDDHKCPGMLSGTVFGLGVIFALAGIAMMLGRRKKAEKV